MRSPKKLRWTAAALAAVLASLAPVGAAADPVTLEEPVRKHVTVPSELHVGPVVFRLPPVYLMSEGVKDALDLEVRRLQDAETRLTAENKSLRDGAGRWGTVALIVVSVLAVAGGYYAGDKLGDHLPSPL